MFDNVLFISEVRKHPELWDSNHREFNHRQAKQSAWEEVAANTFSDSENWSNYDKFGKVREIQKRWKNLKDAFSRDLKYQRKVERGQAMAKKRQYIYAQLLDFLHVGRKPTKQSRSRSSSSSSSSEENDRDADNEMSVQETTQVTGEVEHIEVNPDPSSYQNVSSSQDNHRLNQALQGTSYQDTFHEQYTPDQSGSGRHVPLTYAIPSMHEMPETDDDKMFLLSLLPYFKKLDQSKKLHARIEVMKTIDHLLFKQK